MRPVWLAAGLGFTGLGLAGVVLPVVPTTPFLLLAAACFARSSPRLHGWLVAHPVFGPPIRDWQAHGAISRRAKTLALASMAAVVGASAWIGLSGWILALQAGLVALGAAFILTRPSGPRG